MATNSLIGYAVATLSDPTPGASLIGYAVGTLTDPAPTVGPSAIGYAVGVLVDPANHGPSQIGFAVRDIGYVHRPVKVLMADGSLKSIPIRTWDGTKLR
jgi:hypothetical protein